MADPLPGAQRGYPLARLTTIRTGGPAELLARAGTLSELERGLAWAREERVQVGVVGSGSNLLVADAGVPGLVLRLDKELSEIELEDTHIHRGGAARLPTVAARAAQGCLTGEVQALGPVVSPAEWDLR
jgi:UDP-N-acetylmuramate dehydrogenase